MEYVLIVLFVMVAAFGFLGLGKRIFKSSQQNTNAPILDNSYYTDDAVKNIGLSPRNGYIKLSIVGMYYRDLTLLDVGSFEGYAEAQPSNEHDKFAVAIYGNKNVHLGFIPRGNEKLHQYILECGGSVNAYGYVAYSKRDGYYGMVCVNTKY